MGQLIQATGITYYPAQELLSELLERLHTVKWIEIEIDICPHANETALDLFALHGYTVNDRMNILYASSRARIFRRQMSQKSRYLGLPKRINEFPSRSLAGCKHGGRPELLLGMLARTAVPYYAWMQIFMAYRSIGK